MKVSVSLKEQDLEFIDQYSEENALTRSAAIQEAIKLLRNVDLAKQYEAEFSDPAWQEEAALWDVTVGDGLDEPD